MNTDSDEIFKILFFKNPVPMVLFEPESQKIVEVNEASEILYNKSRSQMLEMYFSELISASDVKCQPQSSNNHQQKKQDQKIVGGIFEIANKQISARIKVSSVNCFNHCVHLATIENITTRDIEIEKLQNENNKYKFLTEEAFDALWDWDLKSGKLKWNDHAKIMFDIKDQIEIEKPDWWSSNLHPEDRTRVEENLNYHLKQKITKWQEDYRFKCGNGEYKYIHDKGYLMYDTNNTPVRMIGAMQDMTATTTHEMMLQSLNNSLKIRAKELAESNEELERFAYVASHDLQEPLRMVTSFLQLLEKKYKNQLDKKAKEYINFAVDGAERMKKLILDLLEYSRVNSAPVEHEEVDLNEIIKDISFTFKAILKNTNTSIIFETLPKIKGNRTQLLQLFQNLIENAIKYRGNDPPMITIACEEELHDFKISVTDNGIGIDSRFFSKIFIIFQRLHSREKYSGTGIGLAICKKIIDKHGGKIWLTSRLGEGSTFYLTLPKP